MLSAFYEVCTGRAPDMLRAYLLAVLVQMLAVNALTEYGYLDATVIPFHGLTTVLGGLVFGLGMTLALGCAGAIFYRIGEGKLDYVFSVGAYAVGAWASNNWLVPPVMALLGGEGLPLTLHGAVAMDRWIVIAIAVVVILLWELRGHRHAYQGGWDWSRTGLLVGIIGVAAWAGSAFAGKAAGLGTVQGSDSLATFLLERDPSALNWGLFVVVGIPLGSFLAARRAGAPASRPFHLRHVPQAVGGGLLMGLGAALASGDNLVHGLSGVPLLAVSSLVFMVCAFLGVWCGVRLHWVR